MILKLEFDVDSDTILDDKIEWRVNQYLFKFWPSAQNTLEKISVECKVLDYKDCVPEVSFEDGKMSKIVFPRRAFYEEQKKMVQHLESFGAMDMGIRKINWDTPYITWIPESDEERIPITGYGTKMDYPANNRKITLRWIQDTLAFRNMVGHLDEPLSFFRIGVNHYHQHSYIQAFLHFYMMLEGFFGGRNTNKKITIDSFLTAPHFIYAVGMVLERFDSSRPDKHSDWFAKYVFLNKTIEEDPVRKIINIFFDERGKLAHYLATDSERRRNNFEDGKYQSLAFLSMSVCLFATNKLRIDPFRPKSSS